MANPQRENGHLDIANELVEHLAKTRMSPYEWCFVVALLRKTWAWNKKADAVPLSQIAEMTGIHKSHISRTKKLLIQRRIVTPLGNSILMFNKNYDQWQKLPKGVNTHKLPKGVMIVTKRGNKKLPKGADSKEHKETSSKEHPPPPPKNQKTRISEITEHLKTQGVDPALFLPIWNEWVKNRQGKKWKNVASEKKGINLLLKLSQSDLDLSQKIIDQSLANNWQGLFALKQGDTTDQYLMD